MYHKLFIIINKNFMVIKICLLKNSSIYILKKKIIAKLLNIYKIKLLIEKILLKMEEKLDKLFSIFEDIKKKNLFALCVR
jgi:hypothetical protein